MGHWGGSAVFSLGEARVRERLGFPPPGDALYETLRVARFPVGVRKLALRYANGSPSLLEQQDRATSPSRATTVIGHGN
ncbi:hypothetical protein VB735_04570 [Halotia wernerae UHCC 0503]|nr:hypothetical protein [Halotia wernerae UHCC 0503]